MSQETKDFLIVAVILGLGGWGFLTWQKNNAPITPHSVTVQESYYAEEAEEVSKDKIICKVEPELKSFIQCDKKTHAIKFYTDEAREHLLFEIAAEDLLAECENNQCENVEIPRTLKQFNNDNPRSISLIIPNYLTKDEIIEVIRKGFKTDPPNIGDDVQIHFLSYPDKSFVAEYAFLDFKANIINYYRNKNKVVHILPVEKKESKNTGFVLEDKNYFYSFADFETKLGAFLKDTSPPPITKDMSFHQLVQNIGKVTDNDKSQVVAFILDKTIQFPKARSYELDDQGYSWFYTYQQKYNNDIGNRNRACTQKGYQGCKLDFLWEEPFHEYYLRHTEDTLLPLLNYRFNPDKIEFIILDPRIEVTDKTPLEAEKERIFEALEDMLKEKVTR